MKIHLLARFMGRCVKTIGVANSIFSSKYLYSQAFTDSRVWMWERKEEFWLRAGKTRSMINEVMV